MVGDSAPERKEATFAKTNEDWKPSDAERKLMMRRIGRTNHEPEKTQIDGVTMRIALGSSMSATGKNILVCPCVPLFNLLHN